MHPVPAGLCLNIFQTPCFGVRSIAFLGKYSPELILPTFLTYSAETVRRKNLKKRAINPEEGAWPSQDMAAAS